MHLVEVRLNSFLYRFRRLTWIEESALKVPEGEDARNVLLAHALHDGSGMPVGLVEDAARIVRAIPRTLRWRIWVIYRGNLPGDRYYRMKGLFEAPEPQVYRIRRLVSEEKDHRCRSTLKQTLATDTIILGALLNIVAGALRELPSVDLPQLPRLADFAVWIAAAEPALGWSVERS